MTFVDAETLSKLPTLTHDERDALNFGVVQVDNEGIIEFYSRYAAELTQVDPADAEGRNYFTQVAPCTNNRLVYGKFTEGVAAGSYDLSFPYTFTYKMKPTLVDLHLYRDVPSQTNWVLMQRR